MQLPIRWRYKIDHWRSRIGQMFHSEPKPQRPRICPACGSLVGATTTKCHQCGANVNFSLAAASRTLGRFVPMNSPATYGILTLCCILYGISFLATIHQSGFVPPSGGLGALFNLGGINSNILIRMGASLQLPYDIAQPWRLVTAVFLHASLLHIGFNMWVLMDLGPTLEELYGSARLFFIFVTTGSFGYLVSATFVRFSVGASGGLLGMIGVLLALTTNRQSAGMRMLRSQLIYWLIYIAVMGFLMPGIDNFAHAGGFVSGFLLGKVMIDRKPADADERRRAYSLGWAAGIVVLTSFAFMLLYYFNPQSGI